MSKPEIKDGGPAFPSHFASAVRDGFGGMKLRDYFAAHCDQPGALEIVTAAGLTLSVGTVWSGERTSLGNFDKWFASLLPMERFRLYSTVRYQMADAMLAARGAV